VNSVYGDTAQIVDRCITDEVLIMEFQRAPAASSLTIASDAWEGEAPQTPSASKSHKGFSSMREKAEIAARMPAQVSGAARYAMQIVEIALGEQTRSIKGKFENSFAAAQQKVQSCSVCAKDVEAQSCSVDANDGEGSACGGTHVVTTSISGRFSDTAQKGFDLAKGILRPMWPRARPGGA